MFLVVRAPDYEGIVDDAIGIDGLNFRADDGRPWFDGQVFYPIPPANNSNGLWKPIFDGEGKRRTFGGHRVFLGRVDALESPQPLDDEREDVTLLLSQRYRLPPDHGFHLAILGEVRLAVGMV